MRTVLVTGSDGFIGRNLVVALERCADLQVLRSVRTDEVGSLAAKLARADVVFHLAGVNRPERVEEYGSVNAGLTRQIVAELERSGRGPVIVFASSTQALLDNPYGVSKRQAEEVLAEFGKGRGAPVRIFRLPGVFGKWCRPNYNSVVATFCYNIARGLPIVASDPERELELVYIDDVIEAFVEVLAGASADGCVLCQVEPVHRVTVGRLAQLIQSFRDNRVTLLLPDLADRLVRSLHATYLSYLDPQNLAYTPETRTDHRGALVELLKSPYVGQLFVSHTRPGVTRGNHCHDSKVEKFIVLQGEAVIRFRHVLDGSVTSYRVSGSPIQIVDIPPGYTHSIENVGTDDLVVLFWASEPFDANRPDTFFRQVLDDKA
jgi:UDP-2-acetamido-2,6-beta-L-arabino-hexul-4-ose reductase